MLDEDSEVQQVDENGRWPDKNMGKEGRVDFTKVSWEEAILWFQLREQRCKRHRIGKDNRYLCDQFALLKFAIDQGDVPVFVKLGTSQFQLVRCLAS